MKRIVGVLFALVAVMVSPILFEAFELNRLQGLCAEAGLGAPIEEAIFSVENAAFVKVTQYDRSWSNNNDFENQWVFAESLLANRKIACDIEHDGKRVVSYGASSTFWAWLH